MIFSMGSIVKSGQFFTIYDDSNMYVLEDKTKRNLTVIEHVIDEVYNIYTDKGIIYDGDGRGHKVNIRYYFNKDDYSIEQVYIIALRLDEFYRRLREETCPD